MAGSRIQVNKAHKTRFASKSSRNVHKVSLKDKHRIAKSEHNLGKGARAARIQRKKMLRDQKRASLLNEKKTLSGSSSPPRVIVLFALSADVDLNSLEKDILTVLSPEGCENYPTVASSEYRIRATGIQVLLSGVVDESSVSEGSWAFFGSFNGLVEFLGSCVWGQLFSFTEQYTISHVRNVYLCLSIADV